MQRGVHLNVNSPCYISSCSTARARAVLGSCNIQRRIATGRAISACSTLRMQCVSRRDDTPRQYALCHTQPQRQDSQNSSAQSLGRPHHCSLSRRELRTEGVEMHAANAISTRGPDYICVERKLCMSCLCARNKTISIIEGGEVVVLVSYGGAARCIPSVLSQGEHTRRPPCCSLAIQTVPPAPRGGCHAQPGPYRPNHVAVEVGEVQEQ